MMLGKITKIFSTIVIWLIAALFLLRLITYIIFLVQVDEKKALQSIGAFYAAYVKKLPWQMLTTSVLLLLFVSCYAVLCVL